MSLSPDDRRWFDEQLDIVVDELPQLVRDLMDDVPMIVDDFPSRGLCAKLRLEYRDDLQGLYDGVSLDEESISSSGHLSARVYLFREGIMAVAADDDDTVSEEDLREQIRITILHEYGHHHGLDEDDLEELGYG